MNRTINLLQKFQQVLPRPSLITIYKAFIRPHLDYGDIKFDQASHNSFHQILESIQFNAFLAITGVIRGTPKEQLYNKKRIAIIFQSSNCKAINFILYS